MTKDIRDSFFDEVYNIAAKNRNTIFITADADAFSLKRYKQDMPNQFLNVGVSEQNMITVAAGLALSGKRVFIYALIPFITLRCFEQIKVNICSMKLPITIVGVGVGLSFTNDGPTHHAVCDIAVMRSLPELSIFNPCDESSAATCANLAYQSGMPAYVRLDKGIFPSLYKRGTPFSQGVLMVKDGTDICLIATGMMVHTAVDAVSELEKENISAAVVDMYRIKPVDKEVILGILNRYKKIVSLEENVLTGGIGSILSELIIDNNLNNKLLRIALPDEQCFLYGTREWLHKQYSVDRGSICSKIGSFLCK
jgi:transketolase